MSDEKNTDKKNGKSAPKRDEAPEGFDTRVGREQGKGWLTKDAGVRVVGRLLGRFVMKGSVGDDGKYRAFYQIQIGEGSGKFEGTKLVGPVTGTATDPDDKDEKIDVEFAIGDILNLGEHKAIEDLSPYTRDGGTYDVHVQYINEDKIPGTKRTFWRVKGPFLKTIKKATKVPGPAPCLKPHSEGMAEEEIPF